MNPFAAMASWSARHPAWVIPLVLLTAAGLGAGMAQAEEGRISELFVPDNLEALDTLHQIQDIWGESEPAFFLYLVDDPTDPDLLRAVAQDIERLQASDAIIEAQGLPSLLEQQVGPLDQASDESIREAASSLIQSGRAEGLAVDDALLVRIELSLPLDVVEVTDLLDAAADASTADADLRAAGFLFIERLQNEDAGADVGILMPLSLGVVILVLSLLFRRPQDVVVPLVTVLVAIVMAYGTVAWAGLPMAPPSFIVMPLLLGLGIDYMLHIVYVYREQDPAGDLPTRFGGTGKSIGLPVFFTAITTLIGFGSFLASSLPQIRIWGLLIGAGALYAFLLGFILMPALYRLTKRKRRPPHQPLAGVLEPLARFVPHRPWTTIAIIGGVTALLGASAALLDVTPDLEFVPDDSEPPVADLNMVQDRFGGQTFASFLISAGDRATLADFEQDLENIPGVGFVDGPIHRLERAGQPDGPLVSPPTEGLATEDWWLVNVGYRFEEGDQVLDALEAMEASTVLDARLTGQDRIQRESDAQFLPNIATSTGIALGLVVLVLLMVFRHVGFGALAFLPLAITIIWQLGIQGLTGIPLNPITAVMTAMMIGVGVDFSIHVMAHYRERRGAGDSSQMAAQHAIESVGKPVLAATITTVFAFSVLGFSSLLPLRDFGRVAAIVVACAFVVSLTLLPAILSLAGRRPHPSDRAVVYALHPENPRFAHPNDRFPVNPRFTDPDVQEWFDQTWQAKR